MQHTIECQARGADSNDTCDGCAAAGEETAAVICTEEYDEGNGWQSAHYCQECWDALEAEKDEEQD